LTNVYPNNKNNKNNNNNKVKSKPLELAGKKIVHMLCGRVDLISSVTVFVWKDSMNYRNVRRTALLCGLKDMC
jgi:hypothetical protein